MKKIMNDPQSFVSEVLDGIICAYGNRLKLVGEDKRVIVRNAQTKENKVSVVTAGGSGHLPVFLGYVGEGLLDGCTVGNVFASPSAQNMLEMIRQTDQGAGVLCLYGNYGGDRMNFEMACEMAGYEGIRAEQLLVCDDVASAPYEQRERRRGVAGLVYAYRIAGAAANKGYSLDEVVRITHEALEKIRSLGVALTPCIVPDVGKPTFTIGENEMELGMGIHGEPGIERCGLMRADELADTLVEKLLADMPLSSGDRVSVMVNGLGSTPLEELLLVYRRVHWLLTELGVTILMPHIGEFATSMEMAGCSVTLFQLTDELEALLREPACTPFYTNANK